MFSSSNLARVRVSSKFRPSARDSISILYSWVEDRARLAFSTLALNF